MTRSEPRLAGELVELLGPVVRARLHGPMMLGEMALVGDEHLYGEVVALEGEFAILQVYESTAGIGRGAPVYASGHGLDVELGPGLLGTVFDGLQRPLSALASADGDFLARGRQMLPLTRDARWTFEPAVHTGAAVLAGSLIGTVGEAQLTHRVLAPPDLSGRVIALAPAGDYRVDETIATVQASNGTQRDVCLSHRWPARRPRPVRARLPLDVPLTTGQRVLDTLFPAPLGGAVGLPGGFGTGKTVLQHQLCKWTEADVIVFVGCGERGNEMAEVLATLPALTDPRTGRPLLDRTVLIANTSDMPVAAREASIYVGVTIAEYYRDMGYRAVLLADSTSRWAEAVREIAGRLGETPAEEGYPPYLASRLAEFYERAGRVTTLEGREGSLTIIGAISPPGGDFTEPVTRHTQRYARSFWTLDKRLAQARRFPAISIVDSYSERVAAFAPWWVERTGADWLSLRTRAMHLLDEAARIESTARLIGTSSLAPWQQVTLAFSGLFEDAFLRQLANERSDEWCSPRRQVGLLALLLRVADAAFQATEGGVTVGAILDLPVVSEIRRAPVAIPETDVSRLDDLATRFERDCAALEQTPMVIS